MYKITAYTKRKAREYGVKVKPSTNPSKKIDVFDKNGDKIASVGGIRKNGVPYMDYPNYIKKIGKEKADIKRKNYLKRHSKEQKTTTKNGKKTYTNSFWADVLLW